MTSTPTAIFRNKDTSFNAIGSYFGDILCTYLTNRKDYNEQYCLPFNFISGDFNTDKVSNSGSIGLGLGASLAGSNFLFDLSKASNGTFKPIWTYTANAFATNQSMITIGAVAKQWLEHPDSPSH
jgi:hypothetical protein